MQVVASFPGADPIQRGRRPVSAWPSRMRKPCCYKGRALTFFLGQGQPEQLVPLGNGRFSKLIEHLLARRSLRSKREKADRLPEPSLRLAGGRANHSVGIRS